MGKIKDIAIELTENGYQGDISELTVGDAIKLNEMYKEKYGSGK